MTRYCHHIIPKHEWKTRFGNLDGVNAIDNLVYLSLEDHAQIHKRMGEEGSKNDELAYRRMCNSIGNEELHKKLCTLAKQTKEFSELKRKQSIGNQNARGSVRSEDFKKAVGDRLRGIPHSPEQNLKQSKRQLGKKRGSYKPETKTRKRWSVESRQKQSVSLTGKKRGPYQKRKT